MSVVDNVSYMKHEIKRIQLKAQQHEITQRLHSNLSIRLTLAPTGFYS